MTAEPPTSGPLVEVSHVQCGKDRGEHGHQAPREKESCVSKLQIKAREEQKKKISPSIKRTQNSWGARRK